MSTHRHPAHHGRWPETLGIVLLLLWVADCAEVSENLQNCINGYPLKEATVFQHFLREKPQPLRVHKSWTSIKPRMLNLTIATSLTLSRLSNLAAQCRSWSGPMSVVLYTDISAPSRRSLLHENQNDALHLMVESLDDFHTKMENCPTACQLDLLLVYEVIADPIMRLLIPINSMRNHALLNVKTALVAMIDVDLVISKSLYEDLRSPGKMEALMEDCRNSRVYVLPAFDLGNAVLSDESMALVDKAVSLSKSELYPLFLEDRVVQFAGKRFTLGHEATNYSRWFQTTQPYVVDNVPTYEPWFIIDRFRNPFYDARFRGYGFNKISHVDTLRSMNFEFKAHPSGFIVHRPHEKTHSEIIFRKRSFKNYRLQQIKGMTRDLHRAISRSITLGQYKLVMDPGVDWCLARLQWWENKALH